MGHRIIDLFGDPSKADNFNRSQRNARQPKSMVSYVCTKTEKDCIRALGWGAAVNGQGDTRYVRSRTGDVMADLDPTRSGVDAAFGVADTTKLTYFLAHTLYYLKDEEIAGLLQPEGSRMVAIVHRHEGQQGTLFNGECSYGKVGLAVEQVNKLTGERYVHRDMSYLWTSSSKVVHTTAGSYVWTFHMVTKETWIVVLTGTPVLDERVRSRVKAIGPVAAGNEIYEHSLSPSPFPHPGLATLPGARCTLVGGVPVVTLNGTSLPPVRLTSPELYEFLRVAQVGKPRDPDRINELFSLARSHVANGSEFPGKLNFRCSADDLPGHVVLAYITGVTRETELLTALTIYGSAFKAHGALLDGSGMVVNGDSVTTGRTALQLLKRVNEAKKRGDVISGVIAALE